MEIISRKEALEKRLKRYFTGKSCKNGHVCERYTATFQCVECQYNHSQKWIMNNSERQNANNNRAKIRWRESNFEQNAIESRMRASIAGLIKCGRTKKGIYTSKKIGVSSKEFIKHIESQFTYEMNWENRNLWDIDHCRPTSSFDLFDERQMKVCFKWRNLQPLWKEENNFKRAKYTKKDEKLWIKRMRDYGYEGELFLKYQTQI